jgi:hypothetical protein
VTILNPTNNAALNPHSFTTLRGTAKDPDNKSPISYKWVLKRSAKETVLGSGTISNGQDIILPWKPSANVPFSCGGETVRIYLRATDLGIPVDTTLIPGSTGSNFVEVRILYPPC